MALVIETSDEMCSELALKISGKINKLYEITKIRQKTF
jgi:hypothetical protein